MTGSSMNTRVSANGYARSLQTLAGIGFVAYSLTKDGSFICILQGPAFVPSGIYKPTYFVTLTSPTGGHQTIGTPPVSPAPGETVAPSPVFIEEISVDIYKLGQSFSVAPREDADWIVNVTLGIQSSTDFRAASLSLAFPELRISETFNISTIRASADGSGGGGTNWINAVWQIPDSVPKRWFPHNLGTPQLYDLYTKLNLESESDIVDSVSFTTRTGFRTIQLVQSPYTNEQVRSGITAGDNWHFSINGKAFYALGTNIIPFDLFYARTSIEAVRWVLESAVKSGQNMVGIIFCTGWQLNVHLLIASCLGRWNLPALAPKHRGRCLRFLFRL